METAICSIRRRHRSLGVERHRRLGFTGLYFDTTDKRRAWVNIHPASGNDRTIEITIPKN
jgi:hypothetical protein